MKTTCTVPGCGKVLSGRYRLRTHIERFHLNIRKYECKECFKLFKSRDNLHDHMSVHQSPIEVNPAELALYRAHTPALSEPVPIPKLTDLVSRCSDITLKPYIAVCRVYPYPTHQTQVILPEIQQGKGI